MSVVDGDQVIVSSEEADTEKFLFVDCVGPTLSGFEVSQITSSSAVLYWETNEPADGVATWDQVRTLTTGTGSYSGSGTYSCSGGSRCGSPQSGTFNLTATVDFANRTVTTGSISYSGSPLSGEPSGTINSFSYATNTGQATGNPNVTGGGSYTGTTFAVGNAGGVIAKNFTLNLHYTATLSETAVRLAPLGQIAESAGGLVGALRIPGLARPGARPEGDGDDDGRDEAERLRPPKPSATPTKTTPPKRSSTTKRAPAAKKATTKVPAKKSTAKKKTTGKTAAKKSAKKKSV